MSTSQSNATVTPGRIAFATAVLAGITFVYVTEILFQEMLLSLGAGAFVGVGIYLYLPYLFDRNEELDGDVAVPDLGDAHVGAAGGALMAAPVVALSVRFVVESAVTSLAAGLAFAIVAYLVLSFTLPPADERESTEESF